MKRIFSALTVVVRLIVVPALSFLAWQWWEERQEELLLADAMKLDSMPPPSGQAAGDPGSGESHVSPLPTVPAPIPAPQATSPLATPVDAPAGASNRPFADAAPQVTPTRTPFDARLAHAADQPVPDQPLAAATVPAEPGPQTTDQEAAALLLEHQPDGADSAAAEVAGTPSPVAATTTPPIASPRAPAMPTPVVPAAAPLKGDEPTHDGNVRVDATGHGGEGTDSAANTISAPGTAEVDHTETVASMAGDSQQTLATSPVTKYVVDAPRQAVPVPAPLVPIHDFDIRDLGVPDAPSINHALIGFFMPPLGLLGYMLLFSREPQRATSAARGALLSIGLSVLLTAGTVALFWPVISYRAQGWKSFARGATGRPAGHMLSVEDGAASAAPAAVPTARPSPTVPANLKPEDELQLRYKQWQAAWRDQNLSAYIAFYAPDARVTDSDHNTYNVAQWRDRRAHRWRGESAIKLHDIAPPGITANGDQGTVIVALEYLSSLGHDNGVLTLDWQKQGNVWLIISERFDIKAANLPAGVTPTDGAPAG